MFEYRISLVGRARIGKSLLLTRFVKNPNELVGLSNSGADSTKVPIQLILKKEFTGKSIKCYYSSDQREACELSTEDLINLHNELKGNSELKKEISHIEIYVEASEWVKRIIEVTKIKQLVVVDTEGVSGDVEKLDIGTWKSNLFMLLIDSANRDEFAKSIHTMRAVLTGNTILHCVSKRDETLTLVKEDLEQDIKDLEDDAKKIIEDFSATLEELREERSLLTLKEAASNDLVVSIPNIKPNKKQYETGRNYIDDKLEEVLKSYILNDSSDIKLNLNFEDIDKIKCIDKFLEKIRKTAEDVFLKIQFSDIPRSFNNEAFERHIRAEYRLKSDDNGYLVKRQWDYIQFIRIKLFKELEKICFDQDLSLSEREQAYILQKYYSAILKKIIWINYLVTSKDGREETTQATIISMLHADKILKSLDEEGQLENTLTRSIPHGKEKGWDKNSLHFKDASFTPFHYAIQEINYNEGIEKFFHKVIKPISLYAINYSAKELQN